MRFSHFFYFCPLFKSCVCVCVCACVRACVSTESSIIIYHQPLIQLEHEKTIVVLSDNVGLLFELVYLLLNQYSNIMYKLLFLIVSKMIL
jgi:hypothetical protein